MRFTLCVLVVMWATALWAAEDRSVEDLVKALSSSDNEERIAAEDALADLGPKAKDAADKLVGLLADKDAKVRWHAARALGAIGAEAAVEPLTKALDDADATVRAQSAFALGRIGEASKPAVAKLVKLVTDQEPLVRRAAIRALREIRPGPKVIVPLMAKVLEDQDPSVILPALHTLAEVGEPVVPAMVEALKNKKTRYWATLVLTDLGPKAKDAVPELVKLLKVKDEPELQMQVLIALGEIGPAAKAAVPAIVDSLNDPATALCFCAVYALGKIGSKAAEEDLRKAMQKSDNHVTRMLSAWALSRGNPDDEQLAKQAVDLLIAGLNHEDAQVRNVAARAVVELGRPTEKALPHIIESLDDLDPSGLANVVQALASMGESAVPRLVKALETPELRDKALLVLLRLGPKAKGAVPALTKLAQADDPAVRIEAQFALAAIGPEAAPAVDALIESLAGEEERVRYSAAYALGKIGDPARKALPKLMSNLASEDRQLRLVSVWALVQIEPRNRRVVKLAVPLLTKALESERELVRMESANALGNLGDAAKSSIPALKERLDDESELVRTAAKKALEKLEK